MATFSIVMSRGRRAANTMPTIRILLFGLPRMLCEVIEQAITSEPDLAIVEGALVAAHDLGTFSRTKRVDVIIVPADAEEFTEDHVVRLLRANPRLGLIAIDATADRGDLHHLVPAHEPIGPLTRSSVIAAIRAGAVLRRR
jgi:hypothetical protein